MTHICVSKLTIIGSDNGLSPGRRQPIIWTNAGILLIGPLGTNLGKILIRIQTFSLKKLHLKMSSAKWRRSCFGPNVLNPRPTWLFSSISIDLRCSLWLFQIPYGVLRRWCHHHPRWLLYVVQEVTPRTGEACRGRKPGSMYTLQLVSVSFIPNVPSLHESRLWYWWKPILRVGGSHTAFEWGCISA